MKKNKTTIGFSIDKNSQAEVIIREAFCNSVLEILNNWGIDDLSVERLYGAVSVIEQFSIVQKKLTK